MYYVYIHSIDGVVFYVGCSTAQATKTTKTYGSQHVRAYEVSKRSRYWKAFVMGRKVSVEIVFYSDSIKEIHTKEKELIAKYGRADKGKGFLVNRGNGGKENKCVNFNRKVSIVQMDFENNQIRIWGSPLEIENELGFLRTNIVKCCRKKQISAYGFKWKYETEGNLEFVKPMASLRMRTNKYRPELAAIGRSEFTTHPHESLALGLSVPRLHGDINQKYIPINNTTINIKKMEVTETEQSIIALTCTKAEKIQKLKAIGKTNKEIAELVGTNAGHVWNVLNKKPSTKQDAVK